MSYECNTYFLDSTTLQDVLKSIELLTIVSHNQDCCTTVGNVLIYPTKKICISVNQDKHLVKVFLHKHNIDVSDQTMLDITTNLLTPQ